LEEKSDPKKGIYSFNRIVELKESKEKNINLAASKD
jgi:hypothetical protein